MIIRRAKRDDWATVVAINAAGAPGVSSLDAAELGRLARGATYFRVAEDAGNVLAYLLAFAPDAAYDGEEFLWFRWNAPRSLYVDQVAVAETRRRMGVASELYRNAARLAGNHGFDWLSCEVNLRPPNPASSRFHSRLGFEQIATLETADNRYVSLQLLDLRRTPA